MKGMCDLINLMLIVLLVPFITLTSTTQNAECHGIHYTTIGYL